jgi:hypothetical protein
LNSLVKFNAITILFKFEVHQLNTSHNNNSKVLFLSSSILKREIPPSCDLDIFREGMFEDL